MNQIFNSAFWTSMFTAVTGWLGDHVFVLDNLLQLGLVALFLVIAVYAASRLCPRIESALKASDNTFIAGLVSLTRLAMPGVWLLLVIVPLAIAIQFDFPHAILDIAANLIAAWIIIHAASVFIAGRTWARLIAISAWSIAALNIMDLLVPVMAFLDRFALQLGEGRISILTVIKAVIILVIFLWAALLLSRIFESKISKFTNLTPSVRVLFSKVFGITLITVAVLIAMSSVGIDLTALAVFGGALGVGIGLGLQKIVSNFFSGVILLMDKSIKPGDVITIGDRYGYVTELGGRYVSVKTMDGKEHLIPNENLISQEVINWSHSDELIRYSIPLGIHYKADVCKAMALCLEAARENPRILSTPEPAIFLTGFGDSAVNLELSVWINDPQNGFFKTQSEILLAVWDKFHEHGVEIPYPQRDLHLRSVDASALKIAEHRE